MEQVESLKFPWSTIKVLAQNSGTPTRCL
jgi:hypothetical protein